MSKEEHASSWIMQAQRIHSSLHPRRRPEILGRFSSFMWDFLDGSMCSAAHIHGEPRLSDLHACVKLGKSWSCCSHAVSSACACVKATGVKFAFRASGAACKDLDKGPESLHPTWRKSPSGESKCVWETWAVLLLLLFGQEFLWSQWQTVPEEMLFFQLKLNVQF